MCKQIPAYMVSASNQHPGLCTLDTGLKPKIMAISHLEVISHLGGCRVEEARVSLPSLGGGAQDTVAEAVTISAPSWTRSSPAQFCPLLASPIPKSHTVALRSPFSPGAVTCFVAYSHPDLVVSVYWLQQHDQGWAPNHPFPSRLIFSLLFTPSNAKCPNGFLNSIAWVVSRPSKMVNTFIRPVVFLNSTINPNICFLNGWQLQRDAGTVNCDLSRKESRLVTNEEMMTFLLFRRFLLVYKVPRNKKLRFVFYSFSYSVSKHNYYITGYVL